MLVNKALRVGYFWPSIKNDAKQLVIKCEKCQKHSTLIHHPAEPLTTMLSPYPFAQWGIEIVGPFFLSPGQMKFLLVAIDYFTKWVEAELLVRITKKEVMKFIWRNIICRFGLPREIIFDNGQQFQGVTYRILVQGIKRRLERVGGKWTKELTSVFWAYRRIPKGSTGENPFTMMYRTEAIIPAELEIPSFKILHFSEEDNTALRKENLDLIKELREKTFFRTQRYKSTMINAHNRRVKIQSLQVGELVLRRVDASKPVEKLDPTWEGPFKITTAIGRGPMNSKTLKDVRYHDH
ncbi:UNVERIFIED_CONTAM: hypothetical protein Sindi_0052400 [Sesamum indicum]